MTAVSLQAAAVSPALGVGRMAPREHLVDSLRGLALLGVLVVNTLGYGFPMLVPGLSTGGSLLDDAAGFVVLWLVQGKAYPLLAFLFGYSLVLAQRTVFSRTDRADRADGRGRLKRLLLVGLLHGGFLYAGDILTAYALCGLIVLPLLAKRCCFTMGAACVAAFVACLMWGVGIAALPGDAASSAEASALTLSTVSSWAGFVGLNAQTYVLRSTVGLLFSLPTMLTMVLLGVLAARLRLLTHRRWAGLRSRLSGTPLIVALVMALALTVGMAMTTSKAALLAWCAMPVGWVLSLCVCALLARRWDASRPGWLGSLAPLGRYTLTLYLLSSAVNAWVFSGAGLGWAPGAALTVVMATGAWLAAAALAKGAALFGLRGVPERFVRGQFARSLSS